MDGDVSLNQVLPLEEPDFAQEADSSNIEKSIDPAIWRRVFHYAYSLVRDQADAEDLTQEAFFVLFREQEAGRSVERMGAWMRTVTKHLAHRRYVEQRPDLHMSLDVLKEGIDRVPWELADPGPSPEKRVIDETMLQLSAKVLYEFSERDRECILMYFRGYDFQQIASVIGLSRWTARRLTLKALRRFQSRMNPSR